MATRLITSDEQLRRYLPNAFATAQGEPPFFDKVLPWLETAERWVFQQFIGDTFEPSLLAMGENEPVRLTATCVVAHEAMLRAVPSLDLVLTPNGFGIVSNQNVAPASRERVSRLIASLETSRDNAIEQLITYLFRETEWYDSLTRHWFTATLFPNLDLANLCGFTEHRWANYLGLRSNAITIETEIANDYVSPEQLAVFRNEVFCMDFEFTLQTSQHNSVLQQLRSIIVRMLRGEPTPIQSLRDIVDFMRKNEEQFAEFRHSDTYRLYEPPIFENKKKSHGYFF